MNNDRELRRKILGDKREKHLPLNGTKTVR